jgi:superfamily II DNA/RNA helicase
LHRFLTENHPTDSINALVIVPTRELAIQIEQHLEGLSYYTNVSSIAVYGGGDGNAFIQERKALSMGADIVVCTPGKMMAHIKMGYVQLKGLKYLVLDEADRMLDMGFYDDIRFILNHLPSNRQSLLFSATMPPKIRKLAKEILHNPEEVTIAVSKPNEKIRQLAYAVYEEQKIPLVISMLEGSQYKSVLIFCSSKQSVKQLTRMLKRKGVQADEIHSDLEQEQREKVLSNFRSKQLKVLIATDILSRGIDIDTIEMVINFDVPHDGEDYVHRIGRTARASADGEACTLVSPKEQYKFRKIEALIGKDVPKGVVPDILGPAPEFKELSIKPRSSGNKKRYYKPRKK